MELTRRNSGLIPLAAEDGGGRRRQLPGLAGPRPDDLDAGPLPVHDVGAEQGRLPENPGGARQTGEDDRRVDRGRRTAAQGVRRAARRVPRSGSPRRASRPTTSWPAPARRPRPPKPRRPRPARRNARSWSPQAKRDIEAETRRSLEQIRKEVADLTVLATEKVTRKSAHRRRPAPPGRGGAQRGRLHQPLGVGELELMPEAARVYAEALFEVAKEKGKLDAIGERARPVRRRRRRRPRAAGLLLQPLLLLGGEDRGAEAGDRRRRPRAGQLPRAADREAPDDRRSSASGASSSSSGSRRTSGST